MISLRKLLDWENAGTSADNRRVRCEMERFLPTRVLHFRVTLMWTIDETRCAGTGKGELSQSADAQPEEDPIKILSILVDTIVAQFEAISVISTANVSTTTGE